MKTRLIALLFLLLAGMPGGLQAATPARHTFGWKDEDFLLDGKPIVIRGGEMHFRLELESGGQRSVQGLTNPVLETPSVSASP